MLGRPSGVFKETFSIYCNFLVLMRIEIFRENCKIYGNFKQTRLRRLKVLREVKSFNKASRKVPKKLQEKLKIAYKSSKKGALENLKSQGAQEAPISTDTREKK